MSPQEAFVTRLRRTRQRAGVSLEQIAAELRIKPDLLAALENNDLSGWPRGVYARAWVRAYAVIVGLDPLDTVDEFCRLFAHGDRRASAVIKEIAAIVATKSEYRDEFAHPEDRRHGAEGEPAEKPSWHTPVTQGARAFWLRVTTLAGPHLRTRRSPRASM
jgi:transcriptional regulator with XRE-family HTH domain